MDIKKKSLARLFLRKKQASTRVSEFKARLDINPRLPNKELLKIVDALNEIGNLPIEVLKSLKLV